MKTGTPITVPRLLTVAAAIEFNRERAKRALAQEVEDLKLRILPQIGISDVSTITVQAGGFSQRAVDVLKMQLTSDPRVTVVQYGVSPILDISWDLSKP
jgi:hypothetical protein